MTENPFRLPPEAEELLDPPEAEELLNPPEVEELLWAAAARTADAWVDPDGGDLVDAVLAQPATGLVAAEEEREHLLAAWEQTTWQIAKWQAVQIRILADTLDHALHAADGRTPDMEIRDLAAELALAVGMSDRTIAAQMGDAMVMRDRFPAVLETLRSGRLSRAHAQAIADEGTRLDDDDVSAEYERLVLERADGLTTARLRAAAKAIAEQLMPIPLAERHVQARERRRVGIRDVEDGMAELYALIPAVLAHGLYDRLTQQARTVKDAEKAAAKRAEAARAESERDANSETAAEGVRADSEAEGGHEDPPIRKMDQLRADILCDLALTGHPTLDAVDAHGGEGLGAIRGIVQITVPAAVLTGQPSAVPATLAGHCPVDDETARQIAGAATMWHRILTDAATGDILAVDRRFSSESQRRFLRARDEHCRFPGCRMPVWRCDVDHTIDHAHGGKTSTCNLAHLCRRHHMLKHHTAWRVEQRDHGVLVWTSPAGRVYTDRPPPTVRFIPEPEIVETAA